MKKIGSFFKDFTGIGDRKEQIAQLKLQIQLDNNKLLVMKAIDGKLLKFITFMDKFAKQLGFNFDTTTKPINQIDIANKKLAVSPVSNSPINILSGINNYDNKINQIKTNSTKTGIINKLLNSSTISEAKNSVLSISNRADNLLIKKLQNYALKEANQNNKISDKNSLNNIINQIEPTEISKAVLTGLAQFFASYTPSVEVANQQKTVYYMQNSDRLNPKVIPTV
jgi:hypothetical protein